MGVDYRVWVIPQQRTFRPSPDQVASLANALREGGWVPKPEAPGQNSEVIELLPGESNASRSQKFAAESFTPGWVEFHCQHELLLSWDVLNMTQADVRYPFIFDPYPDFGPPYFHIYLILGDHYFYWTGENVMPFDQQATRCTCGEQLGYEAGWSGAGSQRIYRFCPKCGQNFDPSTIACDVLDAWTGESRSLLGGHVFRFALLVDCHKYFPREVEAGRRFHLHPEFLELWSTHIGVPFELVVTAD